MSHVMYDMYILIQYGAGVRQRGTVYSPYVRELIIPMIFGVRDTQLRSIMERTYVQKTEIPQQDTA